MTCRQRVTQRQAEVTDAARKGMMKRGLADLKHRELVRERRRAMKLIVFTALFMLAVALLAWLGAEFMRP